MIEYFIGILPEDKQKLLDFVEKYNNESNSLSRQKIDIRSEWDDPHGYYTFGIVSDWVSYDEFGKQSFVKSREHFEE